MKRAMFVVAAVFAVVFAAQVFAGGSRSVKVSGDAARDGYLMIDINWTIDTAQYPGELWKTIRDKVADEVWKEVLPQLAKKTSGLSISYDRSNFTPVSDTAKLVEQRGDGSRVYAKHCLVRFNCVRDDTQAPVETEKAHVDKMHDTYHERFVHEGYDGP